MFVAGGVAVSQVPKPIPGTCRRVFVFRRIACRQAQSLAKIA